MSIDELIEKSHKQAVASGWWPNGTNARSVVEIVNNLHGETSEAWEEYRAGRMELWWSTDKLDGVKQRSMEEAHGRLTAAQFVECGGKPEGFWVEIADLCIRLADTMAAYGWKSESLDLASPHSLPLLIHRLHAFVCDLTDDDVPDWHMSAEVQANVIIAVCLAAATKRGVDLLAMCELKMQYNATRPYRHGGKNA